MLVSADNICVEKHHIGQSAADMRDFLRPLNKHFGIDYFAYVKMWPGNVESYLTSCPAFSQAFYDNKIYKTACVGDPSDFPSCYVLLDSTSHEYRKFSESFGLYHKFCIIKQSEGFCERFVFASSKFNPAINNIYINNLAALESHILSFKDSAKDLLSRADDYRIIFPGHCSDTLLHPENESLFPHDRVNVTSREKICAELIMKGLTAKEIARVLHCSPRTVEKHLENLRHKFSCRNIRQLAFLLPFYTDRETSNHFRLRGKGGMRGE